MDFRVTPKLGINFATSALARQTAELQRTQSQISTGIRLQRPSDDPAAVRRAVVQQDRLSRLKTNTVSVELATARLNQAHIQLRNAQELFIQARQVALSAAQATEPAEISSLASELDGILNQLLSIANSSDENGFLFAGTDTREPPFTFDTTRPYGVAVYSGTQADSQLHITGDISREVLTPGSTVFQVVGRDEPVIVGDSGIRPGSGTNTAIGYRTLTVTHSLTTFAPGSGIAAGTSSAASDTIVGGPGTHQLQITDTSGTGAFGTVSLNGGGVIHFTSTDTDLKVTGPNGEFTFLDTTGITAGFDGTIDVTAEGTLSIDGGLSEVPITFADNNAVTDSSDGSVVYPDTTDIRRTGTNSVELIGTTDAFDVLVALRDDLLNTRGLETQHRLDALNRRIADVDRVDNHLLSQIGVQSVSLQQLDRLQTRTEDQTLDQEVRYSDTISADLAAAAVRMQELLNLQQFTMAAVSRLLSQNLLQYLQ
ncbi:MAG: flagellar hook-associated protein FlgL [Planctomycetaceae bacterium]|nr:flagellar hook-associated protein FlgL [Planctomycetaceae bacterium]